MNFTNVCRATSLIAGVLYLSFLVGCSEAEETPNLITPEPVTPTPPGPGGPGLYVGGTALNGNNIAATYWKNGEPTYLSASHSKGVINTTGYDIAVHGDDVYVAGLALTGDGSRAVYWKNGVPTFLSEEESAATFIGVTSDGVYIGGMVEGTNLHKSAVLWKNGQVHKVLTTGETPGGVSDMAIYGTDVYLAGMVHEDGMTRAVYWKNGVQIPLEAETSWAKATSIVVKGADVYVGGSIEQGSDLRAVFWKNGELSLLPNSDQYTEAMDLTMDGEDVYVVGRQTLEVGNSMLIWKNGQLTGDPIHTLSYDFHPNSISVVAGEIIVAASFVHLNEETSAVSSDAVLWYENEFHRLADGDANGALNILFAEKVVVVPE